MVRRRRGIASTIFIYIYIYIYIYILIKFIRGGLECYRLLKDKTVLYQDPNRSSYPIFSCSSFTPFLTSLLLLLCSISCCLFVCLFFFDQKKI